MNECTPLDHARDLLARGLSPIPVPHMMKRPCIAEWQTLRLATDDLPRYFNGAPGNIGTLLGESAGWIVDIDIDNARAVELADTFLPHTAMVWGREGKPRSHRLYRLTRPAPTKKWASKSAGMIVELRSNGCQTIAPGSTHPSGESVRWYEDGEPASIDPAELMAAIEALANAVRTELGEGPPDNPPHGSDNAGSPVPRPKPPGGGSGPSNYGREALRREVAMVAATAEGARNDALNRAAFNVGTLIGGGEVDRVEAEAELSGAARACGLPDAEAGRTIASGIASGMMQPRQRPAQRASVNGTQAGKSGEGIPLSGTHEPIPAYTRFPVDVLPEPIRSFIVEGAKAIGCDASFIALPLLSALGAAIGNTYRIALKGGWTWTEPPILWTAIVGDSGTMKTPAFKLALKAIRKAQAQAFKEHEAAMAEWETEHLRYKAALTAWERDAAKKGGGDGYTVSPPEKPEPPIARRYVVSDTTIEALAPILLDNPRGVLLARDELAGWIGSFDRYAKAGKAGADSAHWLSMHNGEAMTIDRKTGTPPTIHVPSAAVSITGGIQSGILARAMGQEHHESGMLARLLFAMPPRKVKRWTEAELNPETEAAVAAVFDRLSGLAMDVDPQSPLACPDYRPNLVTLAPDGKAAWVRFYNEHATEQAELSGDLSAAWSKIEGYAARLALVIHLTRWAAGDPTLHDPERVDGVSIAAGVALARWFGEEAKRVYAILSETEEERDRRQLAEWIERGGKDRERGTATVRELTHGIRAYRNDAEAAWAALGELVKAGLGRWEPVQDPKGGRATERFRLVPIVTVTETPANAGNDGGSGDGDTGDTPASDGDVTPDGSGSQPRPPSTHGASDPASPSSSPSDGEEMTWTA